MYIVDESKVFERKFFFSLCQTLFFLLLLAAFLGQRNDLAGIFVRKLLSFFIVIIARTASIVLYAVQAYMR